MQLDEFFAGQERSRSIFDALQAAIGRLGNVEMHITKSQVAFYRRKAFAWAWMPGQYLHRAAAPLVLTLSLRQRHPSHRWKEVVEPSPGHFTHHVELYAANEIDDEVCSWLKEAWEAAD